MQSIFIIALIGACVSFTITTTSMFLFLRELVSKWHGKFEELINCPWCLGHYIVLFIMLVSDLELYSISQIQVLNFVLNWFACICVMGIIHFVLLRAYKPVAEAQAYRKLQKMKSKKEQQ